MTPLTATRSGAPRALPALLASLALLYPTSCLDAPPPLAKQPPAPEKSAAASEDTGKEKPEKKPPPPSGDFVDAPVTFGTNQTAPDREGEESGEDQEFLPRELAERFSTPAPTPGEKEPLINELDFELPEQSFPPENESEEPALSLTLPEAGTAALDALLAEAGKAETASENESAEIPPAAETANESESAQPPPVETANESESAQPPPAETLAAAPAEPPPVPPLQSAQPVTRTTQKPERGQENADNPRKAPGLASLAALPARTPISETGRGAAEASHAAQPKENPEISRTIHAALGATFEVPLQGRPWALLNEPEGLHYISKQQTPGGETFLFNSRAAGEYTLPFYRQDYLRDNIIHEYIKVIAETPQPARKTTPAALPAPPPQAAPAPEQPSAPEETADEANLDDLLTQARTAYEEGSIAEALKALNRLRALQPDCGDEALWLYGQCYEAPGATRDIRSSLATYRRLCDEYPQSSHAGDARNRISFLERFYVNIR